MKERQKVKKSQLPYIKTTSTRPPVLFCVCAPRERERVLLHVAERVLAGRKHVSFHERTGISLRCINSMAVELEDRYSVGVVIEGLHDCGVASSRTVVNKDLM